MTTADACEYGTANDVPFVLPPLAPGTYTVVLSKVDPGVQFYFDLTTTDVRP